jgi:hypothetical protein
MANFDLSGGRKVLDRVFERERLGINPAAASLFWLLPNPGSSQN